MTTIDRPIPHWSSIVDACQVNVRQEPQYAAVSNIGDTSKFRLQTSFLVFASSDIRLTLYGVLGPHYLQPPPIVEIRQVRDLATGNR
jgi:hypothetical protein